MTTLQTNINELNLVHSQRGIKVFIFSPTINILYYTKVIFLLLLTTGCASYNDNGELVRHHFGYVKVITPAVHAPDAAVRTLEVETFGVWVNIDTRSEGAKGKGYGSGIGYQFDRKDYIPLDCRTIIRAASMDDIQNLLRKFQKQENYKDEGICIIRESKHSP